MSKRPLPVWGWCCVGGIVGVLGLMAISDREPSQLLVGALVTVAGLILGVSLSGPWSSKP